MPFGGIWDFLGPFGVVRGQTVFTGLLHFCIFLLYMCLFIHFIHIRNSGANPGSAMVWALRGFAISSHELSQYILIYHSNPCQSMMAPIFYIFPLFSFKVLKSPWYFDEKILQFSFGKSLVICFHLWYIAVNKNSSRPAPCAVEQRTVRK